MSEKIKHIIFYSGGLGSFLAAKRVVEQHGAENVILMFTDTKYEHQDLYRFIEEGAYYLGAKLEILSEGRDVFQVFKDVKLMGNTRIDPCSRVLKREVSNKWIRENFKPKDCVLYFGIDWQEEHRTKSIVKNWAPYRVEFPLCQQPFLFPVQRFQILEECGIEKPYLYKIGMSHNNCAGFCVKAGQKHYKTLFHADPNLYKQHEEKELEVYEAIGKKRPFLRMRKDGEMNYITLREYRENYLEPEVEFEMFDYGEGCACFLGDDILLEEDMKDE